jgi:hypothetical protein
LADASPCQGTVVCYKRKAVFVLPEDQGGKGQQPGRRLVREYAQFLAATPTLTLNATVPGEASGVAIMCGEDPIGW